VQYEIGNHATGQLKAKRWLLSRLPALPDADDRKRHVIGTKTPRWKPLVISSSHWRTLTTDGEKDAYIKSLLPL
jgi:hypothetical protein